MLAIKPRKSEARVKGVNEEQARCETLHQLAEPADFAEHAQSIVENSRREVALMSATLDRGVYDRPEFAAALSQLARTERNARVRILVKDIQPLVERGHLLLTLARRLSSKVSIRKLTIEPPQADRAFLIGDRDRLLYQHEEGVYQGFANYQAGPEIKPLLLLFEDLWERQSEVSPDLRRLSL